MDFETKEKEWKQYYKDIGSQKWEFSQMFGEDDSDSELSDSESEEGKYLFKTPLSPQQYYIYIYK